jgi:hypothetical protein
MEGEQELELRYLDEDEIEWQWRQFNEACREFEAERHVPLMFVMVRTAGNGLRHPFIGSLDYEPEVCLAILNAVKAVEQEGQS